jgi:hypothetical protein
VSWLPETSENGTATFGMAAIAEGLVSAAARFASALILGSAAVARMLAPPPIECPLAPNLSVRTRPNRKLAGSPLRCSSHVRQCRRSAAKFAWLGNSPPSDSLAITM